jgi:hypothetical protein
MHGRCSSAEQYSCTIGHTSSARNNFANMCLSTIQQHFRSQLRTSYSLLRSKPGRRALTLALWKGDRVHGPFSDVVIPVLLHLRDFALDIASRRQPSTSQPLPCCSMSEQGSSTSTTEGRASSSGRILTIQTARKREYSLAIGLGVMDCPAVLLSFCD